MRKLLFENLGLKISAVLLSVLLWFFVTSRGQSEMALEVPLEFISVPAGLGIATTSVKTVTVTVRGQERVMKSLRPSSVRVLVDLGKSKDGDGVYYISKDDIKLPYAMTATNVAPTSVSVRMDETISKKVPVKPVVTGLAAGGYMIRSVDVKPREVNVQGLRTDIRRIGEVRTEPLDVSGARETVIQEMGLDAAGGSVKANPASVTVSVAIGRRG